jgi:outer membrane lipopolysaccharide assembly protein LptE/RlpB
LLPEWIQAARRLLVLVVGLGLTAAGCGYRVAGRANTLPPAVKTIAVPAFENRTTTYRIEQRLTSAVVHELLVDTRYRAVSNAADGDAVLHGAVKSIGGAVVVFDQSTGRATTILVTVTMEARLEDRSGKVLYRNDNFVFREPYEISTDVPSFFEESGPAMDRVSRDFARRLVAEMRESY